jgi:aminomethyltransferase
VPGVTEPGTPATDPPADPAPRRGPMHDLHAQLGASFAPFGGWEMPVQYEGCGVVAEHTAVRATVGVFDVSHLGKVRIAGPGAAEFVNSCLTGDLGRVEPGRAQYTLCCTSSGGVVDDLIAYLVGPDEVFCVPNAANTAEVCRLLDAAAPDGITVTDLHTEYGVLAVQGPRSADVLGVARLPTKLDYMAFTDAQWAGRPVRVCRTGYTGEHGYELLPRWADTGLLWRALMEAAVGLGGLPCGLGARDTLRTEMGYPLHGQDLSPSISPVQAGASWAVGWKKDAFWGREALLAERDSGPKRRSRGLRAVERGVPRPDMAVRDGEGTSLGTVTSGTFSPTLRTGIALALLDPAVEPGEEVRVDVRGAPLRCEVVSPPFVPSHVR